MVSVRDFLSRPGLARFPFLFVVTYGRSGSTLLNGLLNSLPGYCIRGENGGALFHLFRAVNAARHARYTFGHKPASSTHSWVGSHLVAPDRLASDLADSFLTNVLSPPITARCVGFKEIRYTDIQMNDEEFREFLDFMAEAFPGAGFVLNVRDVEATSQSGWWPKQPRERALKSLNNARDRLGAFHESHPETSFLFDYDEMKSDPRHFEALCDFLGEPYNAETAASIMQVKHSVTA